MFRKQTEQPDRLALHRCSEKQGSVDIGKSKTERDKGQEYKQIFYKQVTTLNLALRSFNSMHTIAVTVCFRIWQLHVLITTVSKQ